MAWAPTDPVIAGHLVEALVAQQARCLHEGREFPVELVETLSACRVIASSVTARQSPSMLRRPPRTAGRDAHHHGAHLLDLDEAGARMSYSRSTVERLVRLKALPAVRPPVGAMRIHSEDLEAFMNTHREQKPTGAAS